MRRLWAVFLLMGVCCSISQILLFREFMVVFLGNELILGVIFVNWLLTLALGSWGLGRLSEGFRDDLALLASTLVAAALLLPLQILWVRSLASLLAPRGEIVGLLKTFYTTLLVLLPFCSLHGLQFTVGCRLYASRALASPSIALVYVLEALGSVLGGLLFTLLLVHRLQVLELSIVLSLLNLLLASLLLGLRRPRPRLQLASTLLLMLLGLYALSSGLAASVDEVSYRWLWRGLRLMHHENSIYGNVAITRSDGQMDFWVNGLPLFTAPNPDIAYVELVAHLPMLYHPSPRRVLIIGEGLGGVLREVLEHPVEHVTYVELDPLIIELAEAYSVGWVLSDPRVEVVNLDGRLYVKGRPQPYDVVLLHLPSPSTLQLNRFYTAEFFEEVEAVLEEGSVFSLVLPSSPAHIPLEMAERNRCVYRALEEVYPSCVAVPGEHNLFIASRGLSLTYDASELHGRLLERRVEAGTLTLDHLNYLFDPVRRGIALSYLYEGGAANRDGRPMAVYYDLALWNSLISPAYTPLFRLLGCLDPRWLMLIPLLLLPIALRGVSPSTSLGAAILTTGMAGMTISILILYAHQTLCGYLYQELGVVSASFMLGLALGGFHMSRRASRLGFRGLLGLELLVALYMLLLPTALSLPATPLARWLLPLLNCLGGVLIGLEFSLASHLALSHGGAVGRVAGLLYALDLLGGCLGALASSIWLIPLHGLWGASLAILALKAGSLLLLAVGLSHLHLLPAP